VEGALLGPFAPCLDEQGPDRHESPRPSLAAPRIRASAARAIQQGRHQSPEPIEFAEHRIHLCRSHHHRQTSRALCVHDLTDGLERPMQYLRVEKEQSCQRLILRRGADRAARGEVGQERGDLLRAHRLRVPLTMEQHKAPYPRDVSLHRPWAVVPEYEGLLHALEQWAPPAGCWWR